MAPILAVAERKKLGRVPEETKLWETEIDAISDAILRTIYPSCTNTS